MGATTGCFFDPCEGRMSQMTLGPMMPDELREKLEAARSLLLDHANATHVWLEGFFQDCFASGDTDFNEFDRRIGRYEKQAGKIRWLLWEIYDAAKPVETIEVKGEAL